MTWPQNRIYLSRLKSAIDMRQRPTAALFEESDPYHGWTSYDYRIQEAINIMDREVCATCGNPVWICHSTNNSIQFQIKTGACFAKAELEDYEEAPGTEKLGSGEYRYAVPIGIETGEKDEDGNPLYDPLPSRREAMKNMV